MGPKLAVNILSGIEAAELAAALRGSDVARLTRIPGVGKKTAERLVVELKDKMPPVPGGGRGRGRRRPPPRRRKTSSPPWPTSATRAAEAERGVDRALREDGTGRFEDLLRRALQTVSGGAR